MSSIVEGMYSEASRACWKRLVADVSATPLWLFKVSRLKEQFPERIESNDDCKPDSRLPTLTVSGMKSKLLVLLGNVKLYDEEVDGKSGFP